MSWDAYATAWSSLHGGYDPRGAAPLVRGWLRLAYGIGRALAASRVSPNTVTLFGLLLAGGVPALARLGGGWPLAAALLVAASAFADTVDGALAVVARRTTRVGQLYDALADRLAEACWLLALGLLGAPVWLIAVTWMFAWLHEYTRAKAVTAGMTNIGTVTVAERPTRVLVVVFGLAFSGIGGMVLPELAVGTATLATAIWAVLGGVALAQLLIVVRDALR